MDIPKKKRNLPKRKREQLEKTEQAYEARIQQARQKGKEKIAQWYEQALDKWREDNYYQGPANLTLSWQATGSKCCEEALFQIPANGQQPKINIHKLNDKGEFAGLSKGEATLPSPPQSYNCPGTLGCIEIDINFEMVCKCEKASSEPKPGHIHVNY